MDLLSHDISGSSEMTAPERLALAVIEQAVYDAKPGRYTLEREGDKLARMDACDFLANRLWEQDNVWGSLVEKFLSAETRRRFQDRYKKLL